MIGIVLYEPKFEENVGTALRSAFLLGADCLVIIGGTKKILHQATNTPAVQRNIPTFLFSDWPAFKFSFEKDKCAFVAIEMSRPSTLLTAYAHPRNVFYIFGNESYGIPLEIIQQCETTVRIPAIRKESYNLAMAVTLVLYDRQYNKGENES